MIEGLPESVFSEILFIAGTGIFVTVAGIVCLILLVAGIRQKGGKTNITMICPNCGYETKPDFIVCPKCGKAYTIDEKYHGAKHVCKTAQKDTVEYCIYCGEPIVENNQKCTVAKGMDCRVRCPECTVNLRDPKNVNAAGTHYCRFKLVIKPVTPHTGK